MWSQLNGSCISLTKTFDNHDYDNDFGYNGKPNYVQIKRTIEIFTLGDEAEIKMCRDDRIKNESIKFKLNIIREKHKLILIPFNTSNFEVYIVLCRKINGYQGVYYIPTIDDSGQINVVELDPHSIQAKI